MDDKYNVRKPRKPATKQDEIEQKIQVLIKLRDKTPNLAEKQKLQSQIVTLLAQYQRLKL